MCEDQRVQSARRAQEGSSRAYAKQYNNERLHQLLSYETPLKLVSLRADGGLRPPGSKEAGTLSGLISVSNQLSHFTSVQLSGDLGYVLAFSVKKRDIFKLR